MRMPLCFDAGLLGVASASTVSAADRAFVDMRCDFIGGSLVRPQVPHDVTRDTSETLSFRLPLSMAGFDSARRTRTARGTFRIERSGASGDVTLIRDGRRLLLVESSTSERGFTIVVWMNPPTPHGSLTALYTRAEHLEGPDGRSAAIVR